MTTALEITGLVKNYHALRPLRIERLILSPGDHVAIVGVDRPAGEILINLLTGITLPDQGEVRIFDTPTSAIADSDSWLATLDRFGIVSERAVLLESLSVVQNLAMPFSLDIEPPSDALRARAIGLAQEAGVAEVEWDRRVGDLGGPSRLRVRLARALALDPSVLLLEHASDTLEQNDIQPEAANIKRLLTSRHGSDGARVACLTLTSDQAFARSAGARILGLNPSTGRLSEERLRRWFGRGTASL